MLTFYKKVSALSLQKRQKKEQDLLNILFIGDIVGINGCEFLRKNLRGLKSFYGINTVIVNGENSAQGNGILPESAEYLLDSGVDVITGGNHSFKRKEIFEYYSPQKPVIRPANFPKDAPGEGMYILDFGSLRLAVINLIGQLYLEPADSPFKKADELIKMAETNLIFVDFHAEATGEKGALAHYLDGRVSAIVGTHTHVQTSDEQILPKGTGFITDAGMTGAVNSILGVNPEIIVKKFTLRVPVRFEEEEGPCKLEGIIFEICEKTGKTLNVTRIRSGQ